MTVMGIGDLIHSVNRSGAMRYRYAGINDALANLCNGVKAGMSYSDTSQISGFRRKPDDYLGLSAYGF